MFFVKRKSEPCLLFLHLPKTGGISLRSVIFSNYPPSVIYQIEPSSPVRSIRHLKSLPKKDLARLRVITGHTLWGVHRILSQPFVYLTMLREPVERVLSLYSYVRSSPTHRLYKEANALGISLQDFLRWDKVRHEVENQQTKLLAGRWSVNVTCTDELLEMAKNHLEKYMAVGLTERFADSLSLFAHVFGWRNVSVVRANVTAKRLRREDIDEDTLQFIAELNRCDMELYRLAQRLFEQQKNAPDRVLENIIMRPPPREAEDNDFARI